MANDDRKSTSKDVTETDLASDIMGDNQLQGNDQGSVRNQRQAVPDAKLKTEGVVESFEKSEKHESDKRAKD